MNQLSAAEQLVALLRDAMYQRDNAAEVDGDGMSIAYKYREVADSASALCYALQELRDAGGEV